MSISALVWIISIRQQLLNRHPCACITAICCSSAVCTKSMISVWMRKATWRRGDKACIFLAWPVENPKIKSAIYVMYCTYFYHVGGSKNIPWPQKRFVVYRVYHNAGCRYVVLGCAASMFLLGQIWIAVTSTNAGSMHYTLIDSQNLSLHIFAIRNRQL